jgi:hypothetical protein
LQLPISCITSPFTHLPIYGDTPVFPLLFGAWQRFSMTRIARIVVPQRHIM